ncbi:MAG: Cu(I)-responsive transcriptional regulator [Cellvibrionaceae bacterium]|nr:Cu(I)-responsive transcriptional regulator [Cellvibrionaceae bacterium]MCV6625218.1 Cu(I)-responsive transcriptional regulator [Cellvibrionaceae bacterium]
MNISEAAKRSGLSSKTIRYYESIDLIAPAKRADNGYRDYSERDLEMLRFVQRARATGFGIEECRQLLDLYGNQQRHSAHVKALVLEKVAQVESQIQELQSMRTTLKGLAEHCAGDEGPQCAIIDELSALDEVDNNEVDNKGAPS